MKKKIIIIVTIIVVVIGLITSAVYFAVKSNKKKHTVAAVSIDSVCSSASDFEDSSLSGMLYSGGSQNVYLGSDDTLGQILVKKGDSVDVGTPLVTLDTNRLKIDLDTCNTTIQQDDIKIKAINNIINKYKSAAPKSEEPVTEPIDNPETETDTPNENLLSEITSVTQAYKGSGSEEEPYLFKCKSDCIVKASFFKELNDKNVNADIYIYSEDLCDFQYTCALSPSDSKTNIDANYSWKIADIYTLADGTQTIQLNSQTPPADCEFSSYSPESEDENINDEDNGDNSDSIDDADNADTDIDNVPENINGQYTQKELNEMINEQQTKLSEITLKKRQDEIDQHKAKSKYDKATILSTIKGVIASVNEDAAASEPIVTITSGTGLYVKTVVDEFAYNSVKVGDVLHLTVWGDDGDKKVDAKITDISPYPADSGEFTDSSNQNVTYYPINAYIEKSKGLSAGSYANVTFGSTKTSNSYYIDKAYVGKDKKGSFLYIVGKKNTLYKKYIKTGKTMYGTYIEVKTKLNTDGYISSPYSKYAESGAKINPDKLDN